MTTTAATPHEHRRQRGTLVLLAGSLLVLLAVAAASSDNRALWTGADTSTETVGPVVPVEPTATVPPTTVEASTWWSAAGPALSLVAVAVAVIVLLVAVITFSRGAIDWSTLARGRRNRRSAGPMLRSEAPLMVEPDADAILAALHDGPPRNAIVRCWMLLEHDAATAGLQRAPAETSSEYVERVIGASSVDPQPIADLGALFRAARFSSRPIDESQRTQAREALDRTLASLGAPTEQRS